MKNQNKLAGLQKRKAISGYLFIMPFIIGFLAFMVKPFFQSLYMSFCNVEVSGQGIKMTPWGIKSYIRAFTVDIDFNEMLLEELGAMAVDTLAIMVFSFFVALILNQKFKGRAFVRAIFFLPVILSSGVIVGIETDNALLSTMAETIQENTSGTSITSVIEEVLVTAGIGSEVFEVVFEVVDGIYDVAIASGIQIIIFLSGLQTISDNMYEAAQIEGCTAWESLWKITFPMISSLFLVNLIYTVVDSMMKSDNQIMEKISTTMIANLDYGFASAMAWIYFLIVIAVLGLVALILSKVVYYYE